MSSGTARENRSLIVFFLLVFVLSIPFWLFGANPLPIPVNLPISALMAFNPAIAASILVYREHGWNGLRLLWRRVVDFRKTADKRWYIPALFLIPAIYLLAYAFMRWAGLPLPEPQVPLLLAPVFFAVYFISATGEDLGWMGYAIDPMQTRWGAFTAAIVLGVVWQIWHIIPHWQQEHTASWILWQSLYSVALRVLIVWVYNNTGKSVFAAILTHAMDNVSASLFPNFGSHYDPAVTCVIAWLVVIVVVAGWGARTLRRDRGVSAAG